MKMTYVSIYRECTRLLCGLVVSLFIICTNTVSGNAATEYESIKIIPPNVGVFAGRTQQFTAMGTPKGGGPAVDITNEVDWYLEANPLTLQKEKGLEFKDVASIDKNGLLTTISSWGRLNVSACWPRGCAPSGPSLSGPLTILGGPKFQITPVHTSANGTITPATPVKRKLNRKASFTLTPNLCYVAATPINDTCGGTFTDNSATNGTWDYTVNPVTQDCTFETVFTSAGTTYDVTPISVTNGTYPAGTDPVTANCGEAVDLAFTPDVATDTAILGTTDTCNGSLTDNMATAGNWTYTVAGRATDCAADIVFEPEVVATPIASGSGGQTPDSPKTVARTTPVSFSFNLVSAIDTCTDARLDSTDANQCDSAQLTDNGDTTWTYSATPLTFSGACNATVEFFKNQYDVTPISVTGGTYPAGTDPVTANCGDAVNLIFDPTDGTHTAILGAADTCGGTLTKNDDPDPNNVTWTYSIASLAADCGAAVEFVSQQQLYTLTLSAANNGGDGRVYSSPAGPDCDSQGLVFGACPSSSDFNSGTVVTLNVQTVIDPDGTGPIPPQTVGTFDSWSGNDPDCNDGSVTMTKDISCTATFTAP